ncbi:DNA-binding response regulator [Virgisporangium aliadipatigenens]|uniref:DNA-binding response regulator n=1 Tax=Virgisporangium aliadipatigenens TaxID=741659 RepID=A0A8J4DPT3_9ACTN|nr:response regulator transcription factor [Virgisporangium aliadipatigenens]GIJ45251.1 DNA-binding response regulator [Virgisporangium aliadipatigenens]
MFVADDDQEHAEIVREYLESAGYRTTVAPHGRDLPDQVRRIDPDLVLLDMTFSSVNGRDAFRTLLRESSVPVMILTDLAAPDDPGLDLASADDYLTTPFTPAELLLRVRTLLRRAGRGADPARLRVGDITVDTTRRTVTVDGRPVDCTPAEFAILEAMARRPEQIFSRAQLLRRNPGRDHDAADRVVDTHILHLRRKIEPNPRRPTRLLTVYGMGYKLVDGGA